jgi:outer membrane protein assembly factor BamB
MMLRLPIDFFNQTFHAATNSLSQKRGNILVYILMIMVIFGLLGALMVSLFSTSISSSATPNESRRAFYLAEAGLRYGLSELRQKGFSASNIAELNNTLYKMPPSGNFDITVFGAWFKSPTNQNVPGGGPLSVEIDKGKIPPYFYEKTLPAIIPNLYLVVASLDPRSTIKKPGPAEVTTVNGFSYTVGNDTSFTFDIAGDFVIGINKDICMGFNPATGRIFTPSGDSEAYLFLPETAGKIFPRIDGSFLFAGRTFFYKTATEELNGNIKINNITSASLAQVDVQESDYILLAPNNYFITSKGTSGQVTFGGDLDNAVSLSDHNFHSEPDIELDISKVSQIEDNPSFITGGSDSQGDYLQIGGITGSAMGALWFNQPLYLGGATDYCNSGKCFFKNGIRVFFTLEYTGSGDGFIFSLTNGTSNSSTSIGGDLAAAELLGYSGDGRLNADGTQFIPGSTRNLNPPKMGLELDTKINLEKSLKYCSGSNLYADTRNDPGSGGKDAVQYVFWGNSSLDIACRKAPYCDGKTDCTGDPSYDDNRHDAEGSVASNWAFNTSGGINSSPALASDGTIYVGSDSTNFYALNPDGTQKWRLDRNGAWYSPTVAPSGRIYVGSGPTENRLYAINPDNGSVQWTFPTGGAVTTKPAVSSNGAHIYFGSDDGYVYAVNSNGGQEWKFNTFSAVKSSPALSNSGNYLYFGSSTSTGDFFALHADNGNLAWVNSKPSYQAFRSSPVVGPDGSVYVGNDNAQLIAFNGSSGAIRWSTPSSVNPIQSSPAVSTDGSVVYVGSFDGNLYAFNTSNGSEKGRFPTGDVIQGPIAVDSNDHIYFGSNDNRVYAIYFDGTEKWRFLTNNDIRVRPAVKADGSVYVGSYDSQLYAINQFANPKNFRNLRVTSSSSSKIAGFNEGGELVEQVDVSLDNENDWLKGAQSKGPWAIRMEIIRCDSGQPCEPGNVVGDYTLKTWIRQCDQSDCTGTNPVLGTFFEDTRVNYKSTSHNPALKQKIYLNSGDHQYFERFLFGFTSQTASGETQTATIRKFQLSFIRSNDPDVTNDPNWP